jgi:hypothetical protein
MGVGWLVCNFICLQQDWKDHLATPIVFELVAWSMWERDSRRTCDDDNRIWNLRGERLRDGLDLSGQPDLWGFFTLQVECGEPWIQSFQCAGSSP